MDILALWIGRIVVALGGVGIFVVIVWQSIYWITYAVNNSHQRLAATIAGKEWLEVLRNAVKERE